MLEVIFEKVMVEQEDGTYVFSSQAAEEHLGADYIEFQKAINIQPSLEDGHSSIQVNWRGVVVCVLELAGIPSVGALVGQLVYSIKAKAYQEAGELIIRFAMRKGWKHVLKWSAAGIAGMLVASAGYCTIKNW